MEPVQELLDKGTDRPQHMKTATQIARRGENRAVEDMMLCAMLGG